MNLVIKIHKFILNIYIEREKKRKKERNRDHCTTFFFITLLTVFRNLHLDKTYTPFFIEFF